MRVGSLFSGIGGLELGLERAGMQVAFQAEYDKQARRVLQRHWPGVHRYEDVHDVRDAAGTDIDVLCGGFPCQDYSVAGKRGGLAGDRGALWWEMHRIIAEYRPAWVIGENVPGLLSSNGGTDFGTILSSLVGWDVPTPPTGWGNTGLVQGRGDHYGVVFATLDSQYFGVAQRRRRLFIVGHSGGVPRPEVLALSEGLFGHPAPSRETGKGTAATVAPSLNESGPGTSRVGFNGEEGFTVYERHDQDGRVKDIGDGPTPTLSAKAGNGCDLPIVMAHGPSNAEICKDASPTLAARGYKDPPIAFDTTQLTSILNRSNPQPGDPCHPIAAGAHPPAIAFHHTSVPRRLTPRECERLQGFPDGWTELYADGTEVADGPRYRMLGNAVTVNVAEWIGRRIMEAG